MKFALSEERGGVYQYLSVEDVTLYPIVQSMRITPLNTLEVLGVEPKVKEETKR